MILASWGLLGRPLGALLGRLGRLWGLFGAILGVLELSATLRHLQPLWWPPGPVLDRLSALLGGADVPEARATRPGSSWEVLEIPGSRWATGGPGF